MTVLNKHWDVIPADAIYIGRGSIWGNPFVIGNNGDDRKSVINKYREHLLMQVHQGKISLIQLAALHGKDLVCFCKPLACHGDVLAKAAEEAAHSLSRRAA